ncbi:hypothetical protein SELMODRAFT_420529 [Selaginella moellendorffii]|uniref:Pentacotripeptide-repeat region of PRORP domain-containing protein n=1 Tax=Selaginella moellendorffii TaxID=88036 RepID=D8SCA5_SELML|nr:hypothetical protein SELMODRAFT_420529 [Selaginella moellendorffii]
MCQDAMNACSSLEDARALHAHLSSLGMATEFETARRFLELFIRLGSLKDADVVFQSVQTKNLEWWQTMIRAYAAGGDIENVHRLYKVMKSHRMSYNKTTQAQILESCKTKGKLLSVEAVARSERDGGYTRMDKMTTELLSRMTEAIPEFMWKAEKEAKSSSEFESKASTSDKAIMVSQNSTRLIGLPTQKLSTISWSVAGSSNRKLKKFKQDKKEPLVAARRKMIAKPA